MLAGRFSAMRGMGLRNPPPDRRAVYGALRMTARADEMDHARITRTFGADVTELLPMSWALAKAGVWGYDPSLNRRLPIPHKGVVCGISQPGDVMSTGSPGAVEVLSGDVAECRIGGFGPLVNPVGR